LDKIPYQLVVGEKDMAAGVVSPRTREGTQEPPTPVDDFIRRLVELAKPAPIPPAVSPAGNPAAALESKKSG
jgi:threonyl-tRNA synthetase